MNILTLHSFYRSGAASGENRVVEDETRLLSEGGHRVDLFAPGLINPSGLHLFKAGMDLLWSREAVEEVRRRLHSTSPDIVHCHNLFPALSPAVLRALDGQVPAVMTLHNYRLICLPGTFLRNGRVCEDCLNRVPWPGVLHGCYQGSRTASAALATSLLVHRRLDTFAKISMYLAISRFVRDKHVEGGLPRERIIVKPHFAWPAPTRDGPGEYFLYLGRLSPEKGVSTLIEAWRRVNARLLVVGDGPQASYLRSIAPSKVEFRSTVPPERAMELLKSARALLAPSLSHEGAGKSVLEAYAAGVPALASRAGGLPEVVQDGVTGLLLPPGDVQSWEEGIHRLLEDAESERMGQAGWELWKQHYTPEHGLARLESAYRQVLGSKGLSAS